MIKILNLLIVSWLITSLLAGCHASKTVHEMENTPAESSVQTTPADNVSSTLESNTNGSSDSMNNIQKSNCKLIVNGRDITDSAYVFLHADIQDAEIPLTTVLKELGAHVQWSDNANVIITYDGRSCSFDTSLYDYGLPQAPGSRFYIRRIVGNEVIMDLTSVTGFIVHWFNKQIIINYEDGVIEIQ